jgi:hypothetical protein
MATDPVATLEEIGKQFGKRVSTANLIDANVCTSPRDPERPWEILALPGDPFRHKLNITFRGHNITLHANSDFIMVQVAADLDVDVCSINRRDRAFQLNLNQLHIPCFPSFHVYSRQFDTDLRQFLNSAALIQALNNLQLTEHESLHIYRNGLVLYLQRNSRDGVMSAVKVACELAEQFADVDDSMDLAGLPSEFETLLGLIPKWALSDDEKRSELLEGTSLEALRTFVAIVSPFIPAVDAYLDSFGDEPPPAALTLGALVECCLEAQIRIRDSQDK